MSNEELRRQMEFIVEQQAKTAVDLQRLMESHAKAEERISRLESAVVAGITLVNRLNEAQTKMTEVQAAAGKRFDKVILRLDEATARLDTFIIVLEKYISERPKKARNTRSRKRKS